MMSFACGKGILQLPESTFGLNETDIKCFCTTGSGFTSPRLLIFSGHDRQNFGRAFEGIFESGIYLMYTEIFRFMVGYQDDLEMRRDVSRMNQPTAFQISDSKIYSIFLGWIICVGIAVVIFLNERVGFRHTLAKFLNIIFILKQGANSCKRRIHWTIFLALQFLRNAKRLQ